MVKSLPANAGDVTDLGLILGLGRSPGRGHSNPLQYSGLERPTDRGAWQAKVHSIAKSRTRLKSLSTHTHCLKEERIQVTVDGQEFPSLPGSL